MFSEHRIDDRWPQLAYLVNESQVDLLESTSDGVKKITEPLGLVLKTTHFNTFVRSSTAAGLIALGSGDAVVTRV